MARNNSNFSNTTLLTTLESLVLECQLEDAQQENAATSFQMDQTVYAHLQQQPGNDTCADCGCDDDTEWASVTFGIFLCANCSGMHRALGTHISRVRSIKMDSWSDEQLQAMLLGGNRQWQQFLQQRDGGKIMRHGDDTTDNGPAESVAQKYSSPRAEQYSKQLSQRVQQAMAAKNDHDINTTNDNSSPYGKYPVKSSRSIDMSQQVLEHHVSPRSPLDMTPSNENKAAAPSANSLIKNKKQVNPLQSQSHHIPRLQLHRQRFGRSNSSRSLQPGNNSVLPARDLPRRAKSSTMSSAPTITYMGRTFRADQDPLANGDSDTSNQHRPLVDFNSLRQALLHQREQRHAPLRRATTAPWDLLAWRSSSHHERATTAESVEDNDDDSASSPNHTKRQLLKQQVCRSLSFSQADLLEIACDDAEFKRLKEGLKVKGAITNQILKQRLYAFVAKSKIRRKNSTGSSDDASNRPRRSSSLRTPDRQDYKDDGDNDDDDDNVGRME